MWESHVERLTNGAYRANLHWHRGDRHYWPVENGRIFPTFQAAQDAVDIVTEADYAF